ncbi:cytosine adenosine deaminase [Companilactobacillus paralimentarius DSM 13238 = JCM 10415]|uniref:tRNA-specific adenosine deaminase n=1 Tax=Companilactobacillus paralimentarius DSM 13238 = JCM 10415 TaxID=1122151 RepID=A0A0R1PCM7_9LACO|nr:nucleoside deaminase [Companilactobacillus paralimentarius]KAE9564984.1 adenosine deaminase [Companilactobacillus paralimentarius]KRL30193.1 cytosine adenosine deaminase [Companilactobacillus paralimentarius DSM 13238 = JCM 10415]MDR4933363.1 nucleoside deaminase [Companilactobacillus paralimentarius]
MIFSEEKIDNYMDLALNEAKKAGERKEVPIGCIIVDNQTGEVISVGSNEREETQNAIKHAEIIAIEAACAKVGSWRLEHTSLFVTLEPCPMCAGAIINSRIEEVIFGASDPKAGSVGSINNLLAETRYNHQPEVLSGVKEQEAGDLLRNFFREIRRKK